LKIGSRDFDAPKRKILIKIEFLIFFNFANRQYECQLGYPHLVDWFEKKWRNLIKMAILGALNYDFDEFGADF